MRAKLFAVVTTTAPPTKAMSLLGETLLDQGIPLIIVGDKKGPSSYALPGSELLTLETQQGGAYQLGRRLPTGHYARKNIGYLRAIEQGATCIYETDDDNAPLPCWQPRLQNVSVIPCGGPRWMNVYAQYSSEMLWPRGFPLDWVRTETKKQTGKKEDTKASIQQGLVNNSPDVDAIWRLLFDKPVVFNPGPSISLAPGTFCPFNSQSTWWWEKAFPLLYLPSYCSFRMTDIWRSFVAQRCLWQIDERLVFHGPEVVQERNAHNLLDDFKEEIPGYVSNGRIAEELFAVSLKSGEGNVPFNLLACYEALVSKGYFQEDELGLIHLWLNDLKWARPPHAEMDNI